MDRAPRESVIRQWLEQLRIAQPLPGASTRRRVVWAAACGVVTPAVLWGLWLFGGFIWLVTTESRGLFRWRAVLGFGIPALGLLVLGLAIAAALRGARLAQVVSFVLGLAGGCGVLWGVFAVSRLVAERYVEP